MNYSVAFCLVLGFIVLAVESKSVPTQLVHAPPHCPPVDPEFPVFHPDPEDCNKYYECSNGVPIHMSCATGLVWDPSLNTCVINDPIHPVCRPAMDESKTVPVAAQLAQAPPHCPPVDPEFPVFHPDPEDCNKYYECSNGVPIHMTCAAGLVWDPSLNTCVINDPIHPVCTRP